MEHTGTIIQGVCGWSDPSIVQCKKFYPPRCTSSLEKLSFLSRTKLFNCVEIDASTYAIPSSETVERWVAATPKSFTFHMKAFGLLCNGRVDMKNLPSEIREMCTSSSSSVSLKMLGELGRQRLWQLFNASVEPIFRGGKLGCILFQFHLGFLPNQESYDHISYCRQMLSSQYPMVNHPFTLNSPSLIPSHYPLASPFVILFHPLSPLSHLLTHPSLSSSLSHSSSPSPPLTHPLSQAIEFRERAWTNDQNLPSTVEFLSTLQDSCALVASDDLRSEMYPNNGGLSQSTSGSSSSRGSTSGLSKNHGNDHLPIVLTARCNPNFAYVRIHRRSGNQRVLSDDEIAAWIQRIHHVKQERKSDGQPALTGPVYVLWGTGR